MPFEIHNVEGGLMLELSGSVTVRHAAEIAKCLGSSLKSGATVTVRTQELEDVDTCILQMLVSLRKTTAAFVLQDPSQAFVSAVDQCALRRELLGGLKDTQ